MLSTGAQKIINNYLNLPFKGLNGVRCPYFNNARLAQRGQLRVLVGKGAPADIVDEAHIISIQYHAGLFEHSGECCLHNKHTGAPVTADDIRQFLIDHNLGIECSGFVTHVLRAHYLETKKIDITKKLFITSPKNMVRWLITTFRPIENIDVRVFANERNSTQIIGKQTGFDYSKVQAGDVIIEIEKTKPFRCNHIILITNNTSGVLDYVHARAWAGEGKYGHGVTEGKIRILHPGKNLWEQEWMEKGLTGEANETFNEARTARILEIRRLKI